MTRNVPHSGTYGRRRAGLPLPLYGRSNIWENDGGLAGAVVAFNIESIDAGEDVGAENVGGRAGGDDRTLVQQQQLVGEGGGEVQVVAGGEDGEVALAGEAAEQFPQAGLV